MPVNNSTAVHKIITSEILAQKALNYSGRITMPENRNTGNGLSFDNRGTVCIDTYRVLDCCRDRDCFEDTRVYLTASGEDIVANATNVKTRNAQILWAYVGVEKVPFNDGFYQITVRYYIEVECEACCGINRSQIVRGLAVLEKKVVLFGGEGSVTTFSSSPANQFCNIRDFDTVGNNEPTAIVETVEPVVLSTKVLCKEDPCAGSIELPELIRGKLNSELIFISERPHLYVSFGLFSVIRMQRPTQILVSATDYSVPDKECPSTGGDENPCMLFRSIAFPTSQFQGTKGETKKQNDHGICGCSGGKIN